MSKIRLFGVVLLVLSGLLTTSAQAVSTRTRLLSSDNPSSVGQWITLTAEVDALGSRAAPQGQVTFGDGANSLGVALLGAVGAGQATLALGASHSCALTQLGGVQCWGWNAYGQIGDRTLEDRSQAVDVVGLNRGVVAVAAGTRHSCALTRAGGVKCWGDNLSGQLGDGTFNSRPEPVDVVGLTRGVVAISLGAYHSCALTDAGAVECWGWGRRGQLGDGTMANKKSTPVIVARLFRGVVGIAAGAYHTCAVMSAGGAKCWGDNEYGQLGDGTTTMRLAPVNVFGLSTGVVSMSGATRHSCALTNMGGVKCWGMNGFGQLGDGSLLDRLTPVDVVGLKTDVAAISVRGVHSCVVKTTGGAMCWGARALGVRSTVRSSTPVNVAGLSSGVAAIASGNQHSCALLGDGGLACWGSNAKGQLGDGGSRLRGFVSIKAGALHNCGLTPAGGVRCWGWNDSGQLGDGTKVDRAVPADVAGLASGVVSLATAERNTCALTAAGAVKCWGWNQYGQVGDGTSTDRPTPVDVVGLSSNVIALGAARIFAR